MSPHPPTIKNALWITRVKRGLPRKKVASLLGVRSTSMIYRWEKGRALPSLENALMLAALLSMPVEHLFRELREELARKLVRDDGIETNETIRIDTSRKELAKR